MAKLMRVQQGAKPVFDVTVLTKAPGFWAKSRAENTNYQTEVLRYSALKYLEWNQR